MKKILLFLPLLVLFAIPGCGSRSNTCNFSGLTPGGTYIIFFPSTALDGTPITSSVIRIASSTGTISFKTSANCNNVVAVAAINSNIALTASPSSMYLPTPPTTATITGQSFDTTYGIPKVEYFDNNGYLIGSVYATSVTGNGTSLEASVPDLSYVYSGTYQVRVTNKTYEGYYVHTVGSASITAWGRDRADTDGDGWYDDEDCNPYDPNLNYSCTQQCGDTSEGRFYAQPEICPYY